MSHTSDVKTYRAGDHVGLSSGLMLVLALIVFLCLTVASMAVAFGPPVSSPQLGQPPIPNAGWQAQELGGIQPWWQMGRVAPPPSPSVPWVKPFPAPPPMYDTSPGY